MASSPFVDESGCRHWAIFGGVALGERLFEKSLVGVVSAYGLDHVAESTHGNLTMSSAINGPCQNQESHLGWGDINGLNVHY
jgi:hypothetical protein